MEFIAKSLNETKLLAEKIAAQLQGNEIIVLNGDLGSGKTTFTKYLAKAIGVSDTVLSPTFNIVKTYRGKFVLNHFDMYRLTDASELEELGFDEIIYDDGISVIEWNRAKLTKDFIQIDIAKVNENARKFSIEGIDLW